jgi:serine O-acetyltransferase
MASHRASATNFSRLLNQWRQDYAVHDRSLRHRALWALALYRFGQWTDGMRPGIFRWAGEKAYGAAMTFAPIITGVAIDRRMRVGRDFHIIHAGMVLIHPDVVFGDRCGIMHNVTFGTNSRGGKGVPRVGNDVFVGPGAVVLGGITIGDGAVIAANSLVISDVPPGAMAIGVPAKIIPQGIWQAKPDATRPSGFPRRDATAPLQRQRANEAAWQRQGMKRPSGRTA